MRNIFDDKMMEKLEILAKITVSDEEKQKTMEEMERLLSYVEQLNELDTDGVEPLTHWEKNQDQVFREDVVTNTDGKEATLCNAPKVRDGQFVVPKTV